MNNIEIINLFLKNIKEIKPNKYDWNKIKIYFINICKNIINNFNNKNSLNIFIKNYYSYVLLFSYYSNYCYYYNIEINN